MADVARYRLTTPAYIAPHPGAGLRYLEPGTEIVYEGKPGHHMDPINAAAKAAVDKLTEVDRVDPQMAAVQRLATQRFEATEAPAG